MIFVASDSKRITKTYIDWAQPVNTHSALKQLAQKFNTTAKALPMTLEVLLDDGLSDVIKKLGEAGWKPGVFT